MCRHDSSSSVRTAVDPDLSQVEADAADFNLRLAPRNTLRGPFAASDTNYPDVQVWLGDRPTGNFAGNATDVMFMHTTRSFAYYAHHDRRLLSQPLLTCTVHPWTAVSIGYSDSSI